MARNLYEMGDLRPDEDRSWLNETQERRAKIVPAGLLVLFVTIGLIALMLVKTALPDDGAPEAATVDSISDNFALCDDPRGAACVLSGSSYAWRGTLYRLPDIIVPRPDGACAAEMARAGRARAALAMLMNGGAFEALPAPGKVRSARILTRDGVSLSQIMILKGHARPAADGAVNWCDGADA
jgi:endonuclease YncB( thermonuclease family)